MSKRTPPTNVAPSTTNNEWAGKVVVTSNSHPVQIDADYSIWDTTANAYVKPSDTNLFSNK